MKNNLNKNNILFPKNTDLIPIEKKINKKEMKIELNKLNIKADEKEKEKDNLNIKKINDTVENGTKIRPQSVKFKNAPKLRPISSRQYNKVNINIEKNNSSIGKEQINKDNKDNNLVIPIIPDIIASFLDLFNISERPTLKNNVSDIKNNIDEYSLFPIFRFIFSPLYNSMNLAFEYILKGAALIVA
jgi:hypothetical protein